MIIVDLYLDNPGSHAWVEALDVDAHLLDAATWADRMRVAGFARATTAMVPDRRSVTAEADFEPSRWFPDYVTYRTYRQLGGLVIDAVA